MHIQHAKHSESIPSLIPDSSPLLCSSRSESCRMIAQGKQEESDEPSHNEYVYGDRLVYREATVLLARFTVVVPERACLFPLIIIVSVI